MTRSAVPRRWPGSTIICLGAGPSLCAEDLSHIQQSGCPTIAINTAALLAPWAPVFYGSDVAFWQRHPPARLDALYFTLRAGDPAPSPVRELERTGQTGLELDPHGLKSGGHSGYAAVNLAFHLGAATVVLVGYDMQPSPEGRHHTEGCDHPDGSHPRYAQWLDHYAVLRACLLAQGVTIWNCSRETAITALPRAPLAEILGVTA